MNKKFYAQILFEVEVGTDKEQAKDEIENICDFLIHDWLNEDHEIAQILSTNIISKPDDDEFLACFGNKGEKYEPGD